MVMIPVDVIERFALRSFDLELKHFLVFLSQGFMCCSTCPLRPSIQECTGRHVGRHHEV